MRILILISFVIFLPIGVLADERLVRLYVPPTLIETGVMQHILPRFSLKTQVRVELSATPEGVDMIWGDSGRTLFQHSGKLWHMAMVGPPTKSTTRFADWLSGEVGQRTILGFAPAGKTLFTAPIRVEKAEEDFAFAGDPLAGHEVAVAKCGRCHAADEAGRMKDIGSTPSFYVLKAFEDWEERFLSFYVLRPHGAFTQISGVTEPFAQNLPPPITPVSMSLDELDDLVAYVATLQAADLGAPLVHQ